MKQTFKYYLAAATLVFYGQQAPAITLQFDYSLDSNNFFDTQTKKTVLETAGAYFEKTISDKLQAITSGGANSFNPSFNHPATGVFHTINDFSVAEDTLVIFAGGRPFGGSTLGQGGPGGYSVTGSPEFFNTVVTRGQVGVDANNPSNSTDFAPWGGVLSFNTDTSTAWYFDSDVSTDGDVVNNDFFSVALHELGHLFGYGTADSWLNQVSGSVFKGTASSTLFGADVPLSNSGHWLNGTTGLVNGVLQEVAMDPSILFGHRKVFTDLDLAGLSDIGWQVKAVPIPAAIGLFVPGLLGFLLVARRRI